MKRKLLTQIWNEWRDNIWMVLELTIVTGVISLIGLNFYRTVKDYFLPRGFDFEDVYTMSINTVVTDSPHHSSPSEDEASPYNMDLYSLVQRLKENPNVEEVTVHNNGMPYNYNFTGQAIHRLDITDTLGYLGNVRNATPGIVKVLRLESLTGKSTNELEAMLERGEMLISDNSLCEEQGIEVRDMIGKQVFLGNDSSSGYRIGDVVRKVRRTDYEDSWGGTIIQPMDEKNCWGDLAVRLKPGHEIRFKEDFRNNPALRRQRNVYLTNLASLSDTRESCQRLLDNQLHTLTCLVIFLLVTIFLGLLGTFWFRIQQRVGEIALRKVCGATKGDVFRRTLGEGMLLLLMASLLVSAILWPLSGVITHSLWCSRTELLVFEIVAIGLVALGIVVSLWYPARRAMQIEPAIALKTE